MNTDLTLHLGTSNDTIDIGCSKPLNALTIDDFTSDIFNAGAIDNRVEISVVFGPDVEDIPLVSNRMESTEKNDYTGFYKQTRTVNATCGQNNEYHDGIYIRSVFLVTNRNNYTDSYTNGFDVTDSSTRIVTSMDISKVCLVKSMTASDNTAVNDDTSDDKIISRTIPNVYYKTFNHFTDSGYTSYYIVPAWIVVNGDYVTLWNGGMTAYVRYAGGTAGTTTNYKIFDSSNFFSAQPLLDVDEDVVVPNSTFAYDYGNKISGYNIEWYRTSSSNLWNLAPRPNKLMYMYQTAWSGLYFKLTVDGKKYKPIISGGIVTGYTDDLSVKSDIDDWTNINDHNIPDKPITPSDEDDIDDMKLGVGRNYAGMVKYYRLSPAQLLLFSQEIQKESVVPAGYDVMRNIIALKRFPIDLDNYAEFSESELIKLGSVTVPLSASQLAWEKKNVSLGTYTIQGYHGTIENPHFLDFSPYTTAEVFIPYCGFVTIPTDKIMYNEIEVRLLVDVKLGNCTGVVKCNGNIVGQKAGTLGADIPLVAVNMGVAMGAITQGLMDTTLGFVSAIPYAAAGNVAATFSGVLNGASALTQTIMSSKKNYTEVIGTTGGDIMFTMPDRCYIKLTYPKKDLPSNYGKMVGYMCGKGGRLGDFKGFTICENVHVNVKATEEEKQMILEKLLTGVIMPYNS